MNAKQKILLLTYAKFAYMQNLRIRKSLPCVQGLSLQNLLSLLKFLNVTIKCRQFFLTFYGQTFILIKFQKNPPIDFGKEQFYRFLPYMGMAAVLVM